MTSQQINNHYKLTSKLAHNVFNIILNSVIRAVAYRSHGIYHQSGTLIYSMIGRVNMTVLHETR